MKKKGGKHVSSKKHEKSPVVFEIVEQKIFLLRGKRVMIDRDLAQLYGVPTAALNQAVKRNIERFPDDFMFPLSSDELRWWRSQHIVPAKDRRGGSRSAFVFTEHGIAMLSSVLKSKRAIVVNIQIMRTFIRLREYMRDNSEIRRKLEALERRYDEQFHIVFDAIKKILAHDAPDKKREIGFIIEGKKK